MRSLAQALQEHDLLVLRVIGEWWEIELTGSDKNSCIKTLVQTLPQLPLAEEVLQLPAEELQAVQALMAAGGRLPVGTFTRQFGEVRLMGPAALAREEPWLDPATPAEDLWYRGLIYRGFDETDEGVTEFFYIPDELLAILHPATPSLPSPTGKSKKGNPAPAVPTSSKPAPFGKTISPDLLAGKKSSPLPSPATSAPSLPPATRVLQPRPTPAVLPTPTSAIDDMTTLLALAQIGQLQEGQGVTLQPYLHHPDLNRLSLLTTMAVELGMLRQVEQVYKPARTAVEWLQKSRAQQTRVLAEAWSKTAWNELRHTPGLICEGSTWHNDPLTARTVLCDALTLTDEWFALEELVAYIKHHDPDFQRPSGNYEVWYIRDAHAGHYLTGFESWERVEGRLLVYLLQGPLSWLGLAETSEQLYRLTPAGVQWLTDEPANAKDNVEPITVQADATLLVSPYSDRYQRFQAARLAEPTPAEVGQPYLYRLTPRSLDMAREQGITPDKVLQFLTNASGRALPTSTKRAIERWGENGVESKIEQVIILRVKSQEILDKLRQHPKTRPFLGESIGDLAAIVPAGQWEELRHQAAQLGLLVDIDL